MFNKTSSIEFLKYGQVFTDHTENKKRYDKNFLITVKNEDLTYFFQADNDIYLKTLEGIALLIVRNEENKYEEFVVHRIVKIYKGVIFNFLPVSNEAKIEFSFVADTHINSRFFEDEYHYKRIKPTVCIYEVLAYYYNVRSTNYVFPGEKDTYWELTFVDNGKLNTNIEGKQYTVANNQLILYAPGQFHKQSTENTACSYLTVLMDMDISDANAALITNKVFDANRNIRSYMNRFVHANDTHTGFEDDQMIASIHMVILELLCCTTKKDEKCANTPMQQRFENELLNEILIYINENIYCSFNVEELCSHFAISRSSLQSLFKHNLGVAPKEYISNLKLDRSKVLIGENKYTISEISNLLGYSSIHYFSRRFKQKFNISPTDYANKLIK